MTDKIAIIGSDINGAMSNAVKFANCGAGVILYVGDSELQDCDVAAITTNSKHINARLAYRKTRDAIRKFSGWRIYLQEDSNLQGNLPSDIQAVIDELNPRKILICLSSPEKKRHIEGGVVHIRGVPVNQTFLANDHLTPVKEAHIPTLIYNNIGIKSSVIGFDIIDKGPDAIFNHTMEVRDKIIVLDALEDQHFCNIAGAIQLGRDECFTCMTNRLARELPFVHGYSKQKLKAIEPLENKRPVLVVIGSYESNVGTQLKKANKKTGIPIINLETTGLLSLRNRSNKIVMCSEKVKTILKTGDNCAVTTIDGRFIPQLRYKMACLLAEIAAVAIRNGDAGALLTSGSDTTYALCHTLKVKKIDILGSIRTGTSTITSRLHLDSGKQLYIGSRGGAVGGPDEIVEALQILRPAQTV